MLNGLIKSAKTKLSPALKNPYINALRGAPLPTYVKERAQVEIARAIRSGGKLIVRVGATEGEVVAHYVRHRMSKSTPIPYRERLLREMKDLSGFFPASNETFDDFSTMYIAMIARADIYAAWTSFDRHLVPYNVPRVRLVDLDPFFTSNKWTLALRGLRVTVVHPFKDTIERQFLRRDALFSDQTLPDFTLTVIAAPQTHCQADVAGQDWHTNLAEMDREIVLSKPDVLIVGAGAYALPLAGAAKARGTSAITTAGATQLLFGIKGNRWDRDPQYAALYNEHWCRAGESEKPAGFGTLEMSGGAYW